MLTTAVLCGFAVLLLTGDYVREGPVVVSFSTNHGIHRGDVGIVVGWVLGMLGLLLTVLSRSAARCDQPPDSKRSRF